MEPGVMRLIDANANRAREGLRVVEDYCRFVVGDEELCEGLKQLRHALAVCLRRVGGEAVLFRDTPGDVGTGVTAATEGVREDLGSVVVAAGKRVGEAMRALEEYLKIGYPEAARGVEGCRYSFYEIERRVALSLRGGREELARARLYVLITEEACRGGDWVETARAAARGGAQVMQLREKGLEGMELLRRARVFVEVCREYGVVSVINDRPDVAVLAGADGVHVGQGDLPAAEVRRIVGGRMIVGVSTHEIGQAKQALLDGADYIGAGPVYRSATKPREITPGLAYLEELRGFGRPVFAIAGITAERAGEVMATGVTGIAVTAAVTGSGDPEGECRRLRERVG